MSEFTDRTGEINYNNQGLKMQIIEYRKNSDIDVEFLDDGYIKKGIEYRAFKNGKIKNPNFNDSHLINRTGEINYNKYNSKMEIINSYIEFNDKYNKNFSYIDIYFPDYDYVKKHMRYDHFKEGNVKCPYEPRVYGMGYLGEGKYKTKENGKDTKCYKTWIRMLERCYSDKWKNKYPTYKNVTVCKEWLNFQNFAKWYYENYYQIKGERMELDKDILVKGNKMYSPETCVFVPQKINKLFIKNDKARGELPIGVSFYNNSNKFQSHCIYKGKCKTLGCYNNIKDAFDSYKQFKEQYIKEVADEYKDKIPMKLYNAMYSYEVKITD